MPFESEAQRRWMYANRPAMAKQWEKDTPKGKKLPKHVPGTKLYHEKKKRGFVSVDMLTDLLVFVGVFLSFFIVCGGAAHLRFSHCEEPHASEHSAYAADSKASAPDRRFGR